LAFFWRGPNAVWGALGIGLVAGLFLAVISAVKGHGFHWIIIGKSIVFWTVVGALIEIISKVTRRR
jgi:hypothetical protein